MTTSQPEPATAELTPGRCIHCGNPLGSVEGYVDRQFCCHGCKTVYEILHQRGLKQYYELRKKGDHLRAALPASELKESYSYLDDPEFQKLYSSGTSSDVNEASKSARMQFYLEGVHCVACVWLIEKVPEFLPGVTSVHLDMSKSVATVNCEDGKFSEVAREFNRLGYRPHAVRSADIDALQKKENRQFLMRVGVAWASSGNVLLYAISLYAGVGGDYATHFRWISFLFFLPSVFYSAVPFYKSAWSAIRTRTVSIDVPIVLGIVVGTLASLFNLITGSEHIYFDSVSSLIFLLLGSRYILKITQQSALSSAGLLHFLAPSMVRRKKPDGSEEETNADFLSAGDIILVKTGESIPVDGSVVQGSTHLNCALLTGESDWVAIKEGDRVFAGTVNQESPIEIRVSASGATTRLGQILKATEEGMRRKAPIVTIADRVSKWIVLASIALAAVTFFATLGYGWQHAMNRALAIMIVTCPCALALATPFAMTMAMGRAAKIGLLIKGSDVLERLNQVKSVYLDKTGTLTSGSFELLQWIAIDPQATPQNLGRVLWALESGSVHPVAKALVRFIQKAGVQSPLPEVKDFKETIGHGVSGTIDGDRYEACKWVGEAENEGTQIGVHRNGVLIARAVLGDRLREDSAAAIQKLRDLDLDPYILSGDSASAVQSVASRIGIAPDHAVSGVSPEQKSKAVTEPGVEKSLMVGDGANDAVALASAFVGVAAHGGMEVSLRAADAYVHSPGVMPIFQLVQIARETMKVVRRNLIFSGIYNLIGVAAAITGHVGPLFAAILMPISSLTVYASSVLGTRALRKLGRR